MTYTNTAIDRTQILIDRIMQAQTLLALFKTLDYKSVYREAVKLLHPDLCQIPAAGEALIRLNQLRLQYEKGRVITDDAGSIWSKDREAIFRGDSYLLEKSYRNLEQLKHIRGEAALHFQHYLPTTVIVSNTIEAQFSHRALPLYGLQLPQAHVNWVLSRLLEVVAWMAEEGYVHGGINPKSVFIVPETHGIILSSFYHMKREGERLRTISATYKNWYPASVFTQKRASPTIDLECCKRTAAYLLGDRSGLGIKLQRTHLPPFINFLLDHHTDPYTCYQDYRKLLRQHFESRFIPLVL